MEVGGLECLHIGEPVDDSASDLKEAGAAALPAPLLQRARRDLPSICESVLVEVLHGSVLSYVLRQITSRRAGSRGIDWTYSARTAVDIGEKRRDAV